METNFLGVSVIVLRAGAPVSWCGSASPHHNVNAVLCSLVLRLWSELAVVV